MSYYNTTAVEEYSQHNGEEVGFLLYIQNPDSDLLST